MKRRNFIRRTLAGVIGATVAPIVLVNAAKKDPLEEYRCQPAEYDVQEAIRKGLGDCQCYDITEEVRLPDIDHETGSYTGEYSTYTMRQQHTCDNCGGNETHTVTYTKEIQVFTIPIEEYEKQNFMDLGYILPIDSTAGVSV